jgi:hypothetical protein
MPIEVRIDETLRLVRLKASGELTLRDLVEAIEPMLQASGFEPDMPQLLDLGSVERSGITADQMRSLVEVFAKEVPRVGSGRVAVFAPRPVIFGLSRMYEALSEELPMRLRVFRDRDEAEAWLLEAPAGG